MRSEQVSCVTVDPQQLEVAQGVVPLRRFKPVLVGRLSKHSRQKPVRVGRLRLPKQARVVRPVVGPRATPRRARPRRRQHKQAL